MMPNMVAYECAVTQNKGQHVYIFKHTCAEGDALVSIIFPFMQLSQSELQGSLLHLLLLVVVVTTIINYYDK